MRPLNQCIPMCLLLNFCFHFRMGWAWRATPKANDIGTAHDVAKVLVKHFRYLGRSPKELQSDNGAQFTNEVIRYFKLFSLGYWTFFAHLKSSKVFSAYYCFIKFCVFEGKFLQAWASALFMPYQGIHRPAVDLRHLARK